MTRSIHKGRDSRLLLAAAALLFLGACAYLGASLFSGLRALAQAPMPAAAEPGPPLWGVAVRRERAVDPIPGAQDGKRLAGRGVYFAACDGWETLSPDRLDSLTPATLLRLADASPGEPGSARLVEENAWIYAALLRDSEAPAPGPCRLRFAGFGESVPARLLEIREQDGQTLLLFRLLEGGAYLNIRFIEAEIERG